MTSEAPTSSSSALERKKERKNKDKMTRKIERRQKLMNRLMLPGAAPEPVLPKPKKSRRKDDTTLLMNRFNNIPLDFPDTTGLSSGTDSADQAPVAEESKLVSFKKAKRTVKGGKRSKRRTQQELFIQSKQLQEQMEEKKSGGSIKDIAGSLPTEEELGFADYETSTPAPPTAPAPIMATDEAAPSKKGAKKRKAKTKKGGGGDAGAVTTVATAATGSVSGEGKKGGESKKPKKKKKFTAKNRKEELFQFNAVISDAGFQKNPLAVMQEHLLFVNKSEAEAKAEKHKLALSLGLKKKTTKSKTKKKKKKPGKKDATKMVS